MASDRAAYLDYNSTTPVDRRVVDAMIPALEDQFGNPSSENHETGRRARDLVEAARAQVAGLVGARPSDVIFTSGATEANNLVIHGMAANSGAPLRALVGSTEHKSVLEPYRVLSNGGADVRKIPATRDGVIDLGALGEMLDDHADIISIMAANSETGVINPVREAAEMAHACGALLHCDVTQAAGRIPLDMTNMGIDFATLSSHKIYGPKGSGALIATRQARRQIRGILQGGGQENDMRSGTLNVPGIAGFGQACVIAAGEGLEDSARQKKLRDMFEERLAGAIPDIVVNGGNMPRIPNTSSVRIPGALADAVIVNARGIEIATGSACSSSAMEPSHVLTAMGLTTDEANESVRVSFGRPSSESDVDAAVSGIAGAVQYVRGKEAEAGSC